MSECQPTCPPTADPPLYCDTSSRIFPITQNRETLKILGPEWWWFGYVQSGGKFTLNASLVFANFHVDGRVQGDTIVDVTYDYTSKNPVSPCGYRQIGTMTRVSRAVCHDGVVEHDLGEDCEDDAACVAQGTHCSDACICEGSGN